MGGDINNKKTASNLTFVYFFTIKTIKRKCKRGGGGEAHELGAAI